MNKSIVLLLVMIVSFSSLQICCKKESSIIPPTTNPLQLKIEDATCTEVFLKLSFATSEANRTVTPKRGDSSIATITMAGSDSLFVDEGLLPKKTYTYTLVNDSWNVSAQATTQDTTSHNVQWQLPDTLGIQGFIRDVWIFSKTDAWAVGKIIPDSSASSNTAKWVSAVHWDGEKWNPITLTFDCRLYFPNCGGDLISYTQATSLFAFDTNDIWFAAGGAQHFNGNNFTVEAGIAGVGSANKIWGVAGKLWFVGDNGFIAHRTVNGVWAKQESNTTVNLQDIWGIDETHIWATGTTVSDGHSVVLQYNGIKWTTIYENTNKPLNEIFGFNSVWTDRIDRIYLAGESYTRLMNLTNKTFRLLNNPAQWVASRIRGMGRRDIFEARSGSEGLHFNGVSWNVYPELKILNKGDADFLTIQPTSDFILIGGFFYTGLNGIPVAIRGYR